jgi:hypothetical protein
MTPHTEHLSERAYGSGLIEALPDQEKIIWTDLAWIRTRCRVWVSPDDGPGSSIRSRSVAA